MSNGYFEFKQFTVWHDRCAMKVGTDGVLLGAWACAAHPARMLDVGTGTGLIALMLAQRYPSASVTAIEIDPAAAGQAVGNVAQSPWADNISVVCTDFRRFTAALPFDLIVSNPPYFVDALHSPDHRRSMARHTRELSYEQLLAHASELLAPDGSVCLILPAEMEAMVTDIAWKHRLFPQRRLSVFTRAGKPCRRVLLALGRQSADVVNETLCIERAPGIRTPEYAALTQDFYLK
ncbi:MAG: methyltransferase [Prevotellaceae bacterium]|jgi:tRNA1Val (adenine37-N6)-methyltransferase|nr:methyltransferase [Prevotellaceae bacterium]